MRIRGALLLMAAIVACVLLPILHRYSTLMLVPAGYKQLSLSEAARCHLLSTHTTLILGGPHRGGTTLLWRLLASHPSVAGFPERVDSDYSEGSFLQSVLPTFGVGAEHVRGSRSTGLGRYAFSATSHLTEEHPLNSNASSRQLLSEWGWYWNLTKPVLLEKSPTDMLSSRLLQVNEWYEWCGVNGVV